MLFLYLAVILGCSKTAPLSGHIKMDEKGEWKPVVYLIDPKRWEGVAASFMGTVIDSAQVTANGAFFFAALPDAEAPMLLQLAMQRKADAKFPNRLDNDDPGTANYFPIVWQNGAHIGFDSEAAHFQKSAVVKSSLPENEALVQLRDIRQAAFDQYLGSKGDSGQHEAAALLEAEKAMRSYQQAMMTFAAETPHMLPALVAIRWVSVEGDYERLPEFIVGQAERWQREAPVGHPWVAQLAAKADRRSLPVLVGDTLPDYPMPLLSGDTVGLRELLQGKKLVLLDLWASWCAPCRKENRETLVPLWDQYSPAGFQIIGYALEASKGPWAAAIEKDGAKRWLHASDLQGDESALFVELRMTTIPANFLVDENGKVLAKNLHGKELAAWVVAHFDQ